MNAMGISFLCLLLLDVPEHSAAMIHTGIDTMNAEGVYYFSQGAIEKVSLGMGDLMTHQTSDAAGRTAGSPFLLSIEPLSRVRDLGSVPFDNLVVVPDSLAPEATIDGRVWGTELHEGHLYVVCTRNGYWAKVFVREVEVAAPDWDVVVWIIIQWAYQDDGSRDLTTEIETVLETVNWSSIKGGGD